MIKNMSTHIEGLTMGSPLGSTLSKFYMTHKENKLKYFCETSLFRRIYRFGIHSRKNSEKRINHKIPLRKSLLCTLLMTLTLITLTLPWSF